MLKKIAFDLATTVISICILKIFLLKIAVFLRNFLLSLILKMKEATFLVYYTFLRKVKMRFECKKKKDLGSFLRSYNEWNIKNSLQSWAVLH